MKNEQIPILVFGLTEDLTITPSMPFEKFEIVIVVNRKRSNVTAISLGEQFTFDEMVISDLY